MTSPKSPPPRTLLGNLTQAVKTVQAKVDFSKLALKRNARVPQLRIQDANAKESQDYPLLGDHYVLGRSSRSCDIVIRNSIVSQIHASLQRHPKHHRLFTLKDEGSTNGIYRRRRRIKKQLLRHRDRFTLGPSELKAAVQLEYIDPPPWYIQTLRYGLYGVAGMVSLAMVLVAVEWQKFSVRPLPTSNQGPVVILARDQTPLARRRDTVHGELKSLSDFSPHLIDALLASEDSRFYWHMGIDPIGTLRALLTNLADGEIREGGSTLSQQLARSLFRSQVGREDSLGRKFREAVVALKLETAYSKDFLLLTYLNKVYLGVNANGFEDAAQFYFDKSASDLTIAEAATLVGSLPAPNRFNPVRDYDAAVDYRNRVINRMAEQGRITLEEANRARRSRIEISPRAREDLQSTKAPYYYSYVFDELDTLLGRELAQEGNFIVETGLNLAIQDKAEAALRQFVNSTGASAGFSQGAMVTLDFQAGEILALVGGVDYNQSQFNRATQALRQPGSTFKLFGYTAAIAAGIAPRKTYACGPLTWQGQTFAGCRSGAGSMDMYTGMAQSENVIALRVARDVGLNPVVRAAQRLGINSPLNPVPGLVLGQSEVTVLELSQAYAVVANGGKQRSTLAITRIFDAGDCTDTQAYKTCRVIYDRGQDAGGGRQILQPAVASTLNQLLRGVVRSGTGRSAGAISLAAAGKTGTTNDNRDLWFVGYVPSRNLLTGVWLGNDDNSPTFGSSSQAATLWANYMGQIVN